MDNKRVVITDAGEIRVSIFGDGTGTVAVLTELQALAIAQQLLAAAERSLRHTAESSAPARADGLCSLVRRMA